MLSLKTVIKYYNREDVRNAIVEASLDREVAIKYTEKFGHRPDVLNNSQDVIEAVKEGASSFHLSEERWQNPLGLAPNMSSKDLDDNRIGWDFILDIDFELFECSKIIAARVVKAIKKHGIKSISLKFSGNKGFHIGIPFEAFPSKIAGQETRLLFPEGPQRITRYIINYINRPENNFELTNKILEKYSVDELCKSIGKGRNEVFSAVCSKCGAEIKNDAKAVTEFICPTCDYRTLDEKSAYMSCPKCKKLMHKERTEKKRICKCGSSSFREKLNPKIDTILVSSRHMFRAPYSLHEKSGLVSVPLNISKLEEFKKEDANPENVKTTIKFLDRNNAIKEEAKQLLIEAFDYTQKAQVKENNIEYEKLEGSLSEKTFPPCVNKCLLGMNDGRKRSVFFLIGFLSNCGYDNKSIETIIKEWNKKNREPLPETYVIGQLRYRKQQSRAMMPPNCRGFYQELGICFPDSLCDKIKNPVQYAKRKIWIGNNVKKGKNEEKIQRPGKAASKQ